MVVMNLMISSGILYASANQRGELCTREHMPFDPVCQARITADQKVFGEAYLQETPPYKPCTQPNHRNHTSTAT